MMNHEQQRLILCTACNHTYILGGAVTILSALLSLPENAPSAKVYVLDGGIRPEEWDKLTKSVSDLRKGHELIRLQPAMSRFVGLPQDWGSSVMTYARLALPELVEEQRVIYCDADMIVQADLTPFMNLDLSGNVVGASRDVITGKIGNDHLPTEALSLDPESVYFQAGFLVMDLEMWRSECVSQKVLKYLNEFPDYAKYWDQSALNVVLYRHWLQLPDHWNTPAWWADCGKADASPDDSILHFVGPHKPWLLGHHRTPSAGRFYAILDQTMWNGYRPTKLRQFLKQVKYSLGTLRNTLSSRNAF